MENGEIQNTREALSSRLLGRKGYEKTSVFDVILLVLAIVMLFYSFVQAFWLSPVNIVGNSMNYTIYDGDWLITDKLAKPERGDVVIIKIGKDEKGNDVNYIKRIIAVSGDSLRIKNGIVYLKKSGEEEYEVLKETYVADDLNDNGEDREVFLGENEIFFMGDNRSNSRDSRVIGTRHLDDVVGVIPEWSIKNRETIKNYYVFWANLNLKVRSFFGFE